MTKSIDDLINQLNALNEIEIQELLINLKTIEPLQNILEIVQNTTERSGMLHEMRFLF